MQLSVAPLLVSQPTSHPDEEAMRRSFRQNTDSHHSQEGHLDSVTSARLPLVCHQRDKCSSEKSQASQVHHSLWKIIQDEGEEPVLRRLVLKENLRCHLLLPPSLAAQGEGQGELRPGCMAQLLPRTVALAAQPTSKEGRASSPCPSWVVCLCPIACASVTHNRPLDLLSTLAPPFAHAHSSSILFALLSV